MTERSINIWAPLAITKDLNQIKRSLISIIIGPKSKGFRCFFMNGCEKAAESPEIHVEQNETQTNKGCDLYHYFLLSWLQMIMNTASTIVARSAYMLDMGCFVNSSIFKQLNWRKVNFFIVYFCYEYLIYMFNNSFQNIPYSCSFDKHAFITKRESTQQILLMYCFHVGLRFC